MTAEVLPVDLAADTLWADLAADLVADFLVDSTLVGVLATDLWVDSTLAAEVLPTLALVGVTERLCWATGLLEVDLLAADF